ncbi:MAG: SusD/RagB family nutrient-binding outer membrane lipoprotein [Bacteroidota bacterium]|nr:SusD/RagB family nutrient-binding outer membrane lipoprotein [Bacteroidota bacterium]
MKKFLKNKIVLLLGIIFIVGACTKDFEEINTDPNNVTDAPATNVLAFSLRYFTDNFYDDWMDMNNFESYVGHLGKIQYVDESRYEFRESVVNNSWYYLYRVLKNLDIVEKKAIAAENKNLQAVAMTMKAFVFQIGTDTWKAIPYSEALQGDEGITNPKYDAQADIYTDLIAKLKEANDLFNAATIGEIGEGDLLYGGDAAAWQMFCNSLRLRIAIRISNKDATTAQGIFQTIFSDPTNNPIMGSNADNAQFKWEGSAPYKEPWAENNIDDARDDHGMGQPLIDILVQYKDPRLPVIAKDAFPDSSAVIYRGVVPGATEGSFAMDTISRIGDYYRGTADGYSFYLRYPEVQFLIAEAALNGWNVGGIAAKDAYEAGVTASLEEHGVGAAAATYLAEPDVLWDGSADKIYMQKWISLFKQGHEAWAEVRRTDVPLNVEAPGSPYGTHDRSPFRYPYPTDEFNLNGKSINAVATGIVDHFWGQQMWWDTRTGIQ